MVVAQLQVITEVVEEAVAYQLWEEASQAEGVVNLEAEAEANSNEEIEEEAVVVVVASDKVSKERLQISWNLNIPANSTNFN